MTEQDKELIAAFPTGYAYALLLIAYVKRLSGLTMRPTQRLRVLELLNGMTDAVITADMLAAIAPMSEAEAQMFDEAKSLDDDENKLASFAVLTREDVFADFLRLNPSLLDAIRTHAANSEARKLPSKQTDAAPAPAAPLPIASTPSRNWQWASGFLPARV